MNIEIQKREETGEKLRKASSSEAVFNLQEVQEIRNAIQEHMIYIGLDRNNHVRHINLISIGNTGLMIIDKKNLIRTALMNADDRVILVHNHPSNSLKASKEDIQFSSLMYKLLETFDIEFLDHLIVTEDGYLSMMKEEQVNLCYTNDNIELLNACSLHDENNKLKVEKTALLEQIAKMQTKVAVAESEEESL